MIRSLSALYGKVGQNEFGMIVTLGGFTAQANEFRKSKTNLRLIDGSELVKPRPRALRAV